MAYNIAPFCVACALVFVACPWKGAAASIVKKVHADDARTKTKALEIAADGHVKESSSIARAVPATRDEASAADAGKKMLEAARQEALNSDSARTSADSMVKAASKKASELRDAAKASITQIASFAAKDMAASMDKAKTAMKKATDYQTKALADAKGKVQKVMKALKSARTNDEIIKANGEADVACKEALTLASNTQDEFQTMMSNMEKQAIQVKSASDKAGQRIDEKATDTTKELEVLANQVAEVGLTVSAKMTAHDTANEIALHTSAIAQEIKANAHDFSDQAKQTASSTRSAGQDTMENIISEATDLKTEGEHTARRLSETTRLAMQEIEHAKATWVKADVDVMGTMSRIVSPTAQPKSSDAAQKDSTPQSPAKNIWYIKWILGLFGFVILSVTGAILVASHTKRPES